MGLIDKLREWANSGAITSPSTTKQDLGWVNNEQPPHEYENFKQNEQDVYINKLVEINNRHANPAYDSDYDENCSQTPYLNQIHYPHDSDNILSLGGSVETYCSCKGYSHTLEKETVFIADAADNSLIHEIYNDDDFEMSTVSHSITLDAGYDIKSMCCDGEYLYLATDNGGSAKIYKIDINPWTAAPLFTRDVTAGHLFGPGSARRCCIADDDTVAFFSTATMANTPIILLEKDNSTITYGDGNNATFTTETIEGDICSDSTRIWFSVPSSSDSKTYVLNALISDITTGTGSPLKIMDDTNCAGCSFIADRKNVFVISTVPDAGTPTYDMYIGSYNIAAGNWRPMIFKIEDCSMRVDETDCQIIFDGRKLWIRAPFKTSANDPDKNTEQEFVCSFHPAEFEYYSDSYPSGEVVKPTRIFLYETDSSYEASSAKIGGFVYADDCLWCPQRIDGHEVTRIPAISRI